MYIKHISIVLIGIFVSSCVSQKKFSELEALQKTTNDALNSVTIKLNSCNDERDLALASLNSANDQIKFLKANYQDRQSILATQQTRSKYKFEYNPVLKKLSAEQNR